MSHWENGENWQICMWLDSHMQESIGGVKWRSTCVGEIPSQETRLRKTPTLALEGYVIQFTRPSVLPSAVILLHDQSIRRKGVSRAPWNMNAFPYILAHMSRHMHRAYV